MAKAATQPQTAKRKSRSQAAEIWRLLVRNKGAMVGMVITILLVILACTVDLIFDYEAEVISQNLVDRLQPPNSKYWFGTDNLGRDIFKRVAYGTKYSLVIGIVSTAIGTMIALVLGSIAGYFGGKVDITIMRFCDVFGAIPGLLMGMLVVAILGPDLINLMIAMGISAFPGTSRTVRAAVLTVRNSEYVESARAIGMPEWKIIAKYIIPNCMSPIIVAVTLRVGSNIISASSLSFLGLGAQAPMPEWGAMLSEGRGFVRGQPYITVFPGLAIMITVLALNMFGDGLRDAMDPKLRK